MPVWIQGKDMSMVMGLKDTGIALAVLSVVLGSSVCALFWCKGREVGRVDERVLGEVVDNEEVQRVMVRKVLNIVEGA